MALDTLKDLATSLTGAGTTTPYPFDPLSGTEIEKAVSIIRKEKGDHFYYNAVTLLEPRKGEMLVWLEGERKRGRVGANGAKGTNGTNGHSPGSDTNGDAKENGEHKEAKRPARVADVVAIGKGSKVYDGLVDLEAEKVIKWELTDGVQPLVSYIYRLHGKDHLLMY